MPTTNSIAKLFELEDIILHNIETNNTEVHISFSLQRKNHICPHCAALTDKVHDYRTSVIKDIPFMGKKTFLHYRKRRYHCPCCKKHFYENFSLLPKFCRITTRLAFYSIHLLGNRQSVQSVSELLGVSNSFVFRRMKDVAFPKPARLPEVLSIDEFRGNAGGQKFQAILTDAKNHRLFDILPTRSQTDLMLYLQGFSNKKDVKYFVTDMNPHFKEVAKTCFPKALIIADRYHVSRQVMWAMERVRKVEQKHLSQTHRRYFKRSRYLLCKNELDEEECQRLALMFELAPRLATAYYLKNTFLEIMHCINSYEAKKKLADWMLLAEFENMPEFEDCITAYRNWSQEILNAIDYPWSNGFTEGCNNKTKVLKRTCYGVRNFERFRNRILHCAA